MPAVDGAAAPAPFAAAPFAAEGVALERGGRRLVEGLAFDLGPGDLLLVRGANGSGKSTLLRALAGLLRPAAGRLLWGGADVAPDLPGHRARLHLVTVADALKPALTAGENLAFARGLLGGGGGGLGAALAGTGAAPHLASPAAWLSTGQRRRVALARLLAAPRPLWLLDEPETGLDRAGRGLLAGLVTAHRARGGIAAVATHREEAWAPSVLLELPAPAA